MPGEIDLPIPDRGQPARAAASRYFPGGARAAWNSPSRCARPSCATARRWSRWNCPPRCSTPGCAPSTRLPEMSRHLLPGRDAGEDQAVYVPVEPADPFTEAIRTGLEIGARDRLRRSRCRRAPASEGRLSRPVRHPPHRPRALRRGVPRLPAAALGRDRARTPPASPGSCRAPIRWPTCWWWFRSTCSTRCWTPWRSRRRSPWRARAARACELLNPHPESLAEIPHRIPVPAVALRDSSGS